MHSVGRRAGVFICLVLICSLGLLAQDADIKSLKAKAEAGDPAAQTELATAYESGHGVPQNDTLAAKWYQAAAEQGNARAQNDLGVLYRLGHGVNRDFAQAVAWYQLSAKQGYAPGMYNLAVSYYNGDGVGVSDYQAYAWFVLAVRAGSKQAPEAVARMERDLTPERPDGTPSKLDFAKLALAELVREGKDARQDLPFARQLYIEVANHNDSGAQYEAGRMLAEGIGGEVSGAEAVKYLSASNLLQAKQYLAEMYIEGKGVPRDVSKGAEVLSKLAESSPFAAVELGNLYWNGNAIEQNYKKALSWYQRAASAGERDALYKLAIANRDGLGTKKNADQSCMYFALAATIGSSDAKRDFATACHPDNTEKCKAKARAWLKANPRAYAVVQSIAQRAQQQTAAPSAK